ncbi:hypothetical protein HYFRA_00013848 [Hymenoscyphus fraxineus]|uniref:Uncharacterized protein n=1 Tax=Hymenoscyphus fraxineus TaxID=746836 RepID=A0A9N9LBK7_9HELO|nr:hypothetical protein HYFRA_00013848 [Hymenoscyphus fraxineus]
MELKRQDTSSNFRSPPTCSEKSSCCLLCCDSNQNLFSKGRQDALRVSVSSDSTTDIERASGPAPQRKGCFEVNGDHLQLAQDRSKQVIQGLPRTFLRLALLANRVDGLENLLWVFLCSSTEVLVIHTNDMVVGDKIDDQFPGGPEPEIGASTPQPGLQVLGQQPTNLQPTQDLLPFQVKQELENQQPSERQPPMQDTQPETGLMRTNSAPLEQVGMRQTPQPAQFTLTHPHPQNLWGAQRETVNLRTGLDLSGVNPMPQMAQSPQHQQMGAGPSNTGMIQQPGNMQRPRSIAPKEQPVMGAVPSTSTALTMHQPSSAQLTPAVSSAQHQQVRARQAGIEGMTRSRSAQPQVPILPSQHHQVAAPHMGMMAMQRPSPSRQQQNPFFHPPQQVETIQKGMEDMQRSAPKQPIIPRHQALVQQPAQNHYCQPPRQRDNAEEKMHIQVMRLEIQALKCTQESLQRKIEFLESVVHSQQQVINTQEEKFRMLELAINNQARNLLALRGNLSAALGENRQGGNGNWHCDLKELRDYLITHSRNYVVSSTETRIGCFAMEEFQLIKASYDNGK